MHKAYLLLGSNEGDSISLLRQAIELIKFHCGLLIDQSSIYETAPWGLLEQPHFLNQVLVIETSLEPKQLMETILSIEEKMGRIRKEKNGPRMIDIDILLIDDLILETPRLIVPHPALLERRFALTPLCDVAEFEIHPIAKKNIRQLLTSCNDTSDVKKKG